MNTRRGEAGQTTVVMALFLGTFLFGFLAFAVDVQYLFHAKRLAQAAADAAALAAAEESMYGISAEQSAANAMAKANGFDPAASVNPATVTLTAPTTGVYSGSSGYVQAIVTKPVPTFFINVLNHQPTFTIAARAVAAANQTSPSCICLEAASGTGLSLANGSNLNATSCGVAVNSSSSNAITVWGSAVLNVQNLSTVSTTWNNSSNIKSASSISPSTKIIQGIAAACSPSLPPAPTYDATQCTDDPYKHYHSGNSVYTVGPGAAYTNTQAGNVVCYNSLSVGFNSDSVTLNPGIYVINGGTLQFNNGSNGYANLGGDGVMFYLTNGANVTMANGTNVSLTAPSSGTYSGILFYQDPADANALNIQASASTTFNGSIYAPGAELDVSNGSGSSVNADIVAKSLYLSGSGTLNSTPQTNLGTLNGTVARLVE